MGLEADLPLGGGQGGLGVKPFAAEQFLRFFFSKTHFNLIKLF